MFFKNKKKNSEEDLNQKVCKYQRWWQDQTEEAPLRGSNSKKDKLKGGKEQKSWDDSFVFHEMD
jgi:hypothetical protein